MHNYTHHKWCAVLAAFIATTRTIICTSSALHKRREAIAHLKKQAHV